jgi:hypothetical protein
MERISASNDFARRGSALFELVKGATATGLAAGSSRSSWPEGARDEKCGTHLRGDGCEFTGISEGLPNISASAR